MRLLICGFFATVIAFCLFAGMSQMISANEFNKHDMTGVDIFKVKPDDQINFKVREILDQPEPEKKDDKPKQVQVLSEGKTNSEDRSEPMEWVDNLDINQTKLDFGEFESVIDGIDSLRAQSGDQPLSQLMAIEPQYPLDALKKGLEGVVTLVYDVNSKGVAENVRILQSTPANVFDKAAKNAIKKWKFRPRIQNGIAQKVVNLQVTLEFNMEKTR